VSIVDRPGPSDYIVLNRYKHFDPSGRPGPCFPIVYLDGYRTGGASIDDLVFPSDVEGVEVYKGLSEYPGQFASPDARCGVIAVWTRSAPSSDIVDSGTPLWVRSGAALGRRGSTLDLASCPPGRSEAGEPLAPGSRHPGKATSPSVVSSRPPRAGSPGLLPICKARGPAPRPPFRGSGARTGRTHRSC
jgi:hypothetical protein